MPTPPRPPRDPKAVIADSVFAAADMILAPVKNLRAEVEASQLERKDPELRDAIMRSSAWLLKNALKLLGARRPAQQPARQNGQQDAGDGPAAAPGAIDRPDVQV
jgi:hypothetical protein